MTAATDDYVGITQLQSAYADCVTRRAWHELVQLFRADATLLVSDGRSSRMIEGPTAIGRSLPGRSTASTSIATCTQRIAGGSRRESGMRWCGRIRSSHRMRGRTGSTTGS